MARLNLTIPDPLYQRLEQVRDRVNVSKTCATALEKELDMLDRHPAITDPRVARLLERLGTKRGLWYDRGHDDGIAWASEHATRRDLEIAASVLADVEGRVLMANEEDAAQLGIDIGSLPTLPGLEREDIQEHISRWLKKDLGLDPMRVASDDMVPDPQVAAGMRTARQEVDDEAYAEGWRDALKELWQTLVPLLR